MHDFKEQLKEHLPEIGLGMLVGLLLGTLDSLVKVILRS